MPARGVSPTFTVAVEMQPRLGGKVSSEDGRRMGARRAVSGMVPPVSGCGVLLGASPVDGDGVVTVIWPVTARVLPTASVAVTVTVYVPGVV